jgi:Fe-S-cluster containining protein
MITLSRRDRLWNACATKSCCRTTRVHVTAADLARLTSALEVSALDVATAAPLRPPRDADGFVLWPGGPAWELVLRKNGAVGPAGAPCVFLVETNDGHALCGAGDVRPSSCRAFPAVVDRGEVRVNGGACPCHRWSRDDVGDDESAQALLAASEEAADRALIAGWNRGVERRGGRHTVEAFCDHLLAGGRSTP